MHLQRQRYILFEYRMEESDVDISIEKCILRSIWSSLIRLFGEYIAYRSGLWLIKFDPCKKYCIVRCDNITKEKVITAIAFVTELNQIPVIFHTISTSGTIRKILKNQKEFFSKHRN